MSRSIVAVLAFLLLMSGSLSSGEKTSLIGDLGIIDSPQFKGPESPTRLNLAVEMIEGSYYKLKLNDRVVNAGFLRKGFNVIPIESARLFEKSGSYEYELELKYDKGIVSRKIEIRIRLDSENKIGPFESIPRSGPIDREYRLTMYIDGELVSSINRKHYEKFPIKFKMPEIPQTHTPFDPTARDDPMANSFPILGAAALAYKLFRSITTKNDVKKPSWSPVRLWKQRTASYQHTDSRGITKQVRAVITIQLRDS